MPLGLGVVLAVLALWQPRLAGAQDPLRVAAAADLQAVFSALATAFERESRIAVTASFGSSGNFFAQIQNGAPFDVFFSADIDYPRRLVAAKQAEADSLYEYATGRLVIWTRKDSGVDVSTGLAVLTDARVRRIAIANPDHAPYGRAAIAAMRAAGVYPAVTGKLVRGENISQAAQLVDSGNAEVGIIALGLALGPTLRATGTHYEISERLHPRLDQAVVITARSKRKEDARAFIRFLQGRAARQLLAQFGFAVR